MSKSTHACFKKCLSGIYVDNIYRKYMWTHIYDIATTSTSNKVAPPYLPRPRVFFVSPPFFDRGGGRGLSPAEQIGAERVATVIDIWMKKYHYSLDEDFMPYAIQKVRDQVPRVLKVRQQLADGPGHVVVCSVRFPPLSWEDPVRRSGRRQGDDGAVRSMLGGHGSRAKKT